MDYIFLVHTESIQACCSICAVSISCVAVWRLVGRRERDFVSVSTTANENCELALQTSDKIARRLPIGVAQPYHKTQTWPSVCPG